MQLRWSLPVALTLTTLAAHAAPQAPEPPAAATVAAVAAAPDAAALTSGLFLQNFDRTVRPQDDLYRFVNGTWLKNTEIPADKSNYGSFTLLADEAEKNLRVIVDEAAAAKRAGGLRPAADRRLLLELHGRGEDRAARPEAAAARTRAHRRDQGPQAAAWITSRARSC